MMLTDAFSFGRNQASLRSAGTSMVEDMPRRLQQLTHLEA